MSYTLSGSLKDIGLSSLADRNPTLRFAPNRNAVSLAGELLVTDAPVVVTPDPDGSFSVDLAGTDTLSPAGTYYTVQVRYRGPGAYDGVNGYTVLEFPDIHIFLNGDGTLLDSIEPGQASPIVWWVGEEPPTDPAPNTYWLKPSTGDVQKWS